MSDKFMKPQAYQDTWYEYEIMGETFVTEYPEDIPEDAERGEIYHDLFFSRLSAPGYMDCTEWQGPNYTEDGALWELYQSHGQDDETFFSFLEEGKYIEAGSLELRGSRNELYGRGVGEDLIHLATLGDIDLEEDDETGEIREVDYDPNDDPDLPEAYDFEIVSDDPITKRMKLTELRQRVLNAKRDSEFYVNVLVFWLWSDRTWAEDRVSLPMEWSEEDRARRAIEKTRHDLEKDEKHQLRLTLGLPNLLFVGVRGESDEWSEYRDAYPEEVGQ